MKKTKLMLGDNIESLKKLPDNSVDSVVTDPPYGLSFMNKKWDYDVPSVEFWTEVYRVLKPGGHVLSFGGTRTYHRMVVNIEDAGFEIRDQIQWIYGSGFPKSHNIGKAVDKLSGLEIPKNSMRVVNSVGIDNYNGTGSGRRYDSVEYKSKNEYEGWGTALKPANEPICVARKPLSEKSVAENVLKWGTGGINIDGCRVGSEGGGTNCNNRDVNGECLGHNDGGLNLMTDTKHSANKDEGRFPANIILECICDDSISHEDPNCPCRLLDEQSGEGKSTPFIAKNTGYVSGSFTDGNKRGFGYDVNGGYTDKGGASRFFYQAKVSKAERNMGLDGFEEITSGGKGHGLDRRCSHCNTSMLKPEDCKCEEPDWITPAKKNSHPTVKPINLMVYLCRLITPEGGIVLDPFMGSGSTGVASQLEGFRFIGMEMDKDYFKIAEARIDSYEKYNKFKK